MGIDFTTVSSQWKIPSKVIDIGNTTDYIDWEGKMSGQGFRVLERLKGYQ